MNHSPSQLRAAELVTGVSHRCRPRPAVLGPALPSRTGSPASQRSRYRALTPDVGHAHGAYCATFT